jgi:hypothetical protein
MLNSTIHREDTMRRTILVLVALLLCLSPLFAEQSPLELMTGSPVPGPYDGGMFTGFVIDVAGYGCFLAGGLLVSVDLGTGLVFYNIGTLTTAIGGTVWTLYMSQKHDAYSKDGIPAPDDLKNLSWTLVWASLGCTAGSAALQIFTDGVGDIIGIVLGGAAVVIEVCNAWLVRIEWNPKLNDGYSAKHAEGPEVTPIFTASYDPATKGIVGVVGVSIAL